MVLNFNFCIRFHICLG